MSAYNVLPELALSKKCAKCLLTRNAGEKALFRKQSFMIEKAKRKEEKAFQRERELLIQRQSRTREIQTTQLRTRSSSAIKNISRVDGENEWEVNSDTNLYIKQRRKQGLVMNSNPSVASSHESIFSVSTNHCDDLQLTAIPRQNCTTRNLRSLSCVLPPIRPLPLQYSTESKPRK